MSTEFPRDFNNQDFNHLNPGTYSYTSTTAPIIGEQPAQHVQLRGEIEVLIALASHSGLSSELRALAESYIQDVLLDYFDATEVTSNGQN